DTKSVMNIRFVRILSEQRVESRARLIEATSSHVVSSLSGDQNLFSLCGRNVLRQKGHSQNRQSEGFIDFGSFVSKTHELVQDVVRVLEVFESDMKDRRMITNNSSQFGVVIYSKRSTLLQ